MEAPMDLHIGGQGLAMFWISAILSSFNTPHLYACSNTTSHSPPLAPGILNLVLTSQPCNSLPDPGLQQHCSTHQLPSTPQPYSRTPHTLNNHHCATPRSAVSRTRHPLPRPRKPHLNTRQQSGSSAQRDEREVKRRDLVFGGGEGCLAGPAD